ncbi:hypothetical protein SPB21_07315 [Leptothoe sp. ISB3NOV94-8A]
MSVNNYRSERPIQAGSGNVERFQQKFRRSSKEGSEAVREGLNARKEVGVFEKLRLRAQKTGKTVWRWGIGNPGEKKDRVSYKVRGGKLTVADDDGRIIKESQEKGLSKYNGMTLHGKENRKGEMVLKENWANQRKLERGNRHLTPYEKSERTIQRAQPAVSVVKVIAKPVVWAYKLVTKQKGKRAAKGSKLLKSAARTGRKVSNTRRRRR